MADIQELLEENRLLRIELDHYRANAFAQERSGQAVIIDGKRTMFVKKKDAAKLLSISEDKFDDLVSKGFLPKPYAPGSKDGPGRSLIRWDAYELVSWFTSFRRDN